MATSNTFDKGSTLTFVASDYTQSWVAGKGVTFTAKTRTVAKGKPPGPPEQSFPLRKDDTIAIASDGVFVITTQ